MKCFLQVKGRLIRKDEFGIFILKHKKIICNPVWFCIETRRMFFKFFLTHKVRKKSGLNSVLLNLPAGYISAIFLENINSFDVFVTSCIYNLFYDFLVENTRNNFIKKLFA